MCISEKKVNNARTDLKTAGSDVEDLFRFSFPRTKRKPAREHGSIVIGTSLAKGNIRRNLRCQLSHIGQPLCGRGLNPAFMVLQRGKN
jgi:hypothetical protein